MAKLDSLSNEQREVIRAQNDALLRLPDDLNARLKLIEGYRQEKARENDLIAQAKKDVGSNETLKKLTSTTGYGYTQQAIKFINVLIEMPAEARSRTLRQVLKYGDDAGFVYPDLFDAGAIGVGSEDAAGETAGFDKTGEGKRRGGSKAEPRTTEQMAASHEGAAPTPGIPLAEAERLLEEYRAANPPKRGAKPKALKDLEAQVEAARAAHNEAESEGPADLPEAEPGAITEALREGNAESEAHIREASTGPSAPPAEEAAEQSAAAPEKPKRASRKKAEPAAAAAPPPPPPPVDDDEDEGPVVGPAVHRPDAIGSEPPSFRIG